MTPTKKRKTIEAYDNARGVNNAPKAAALLAQAPAAVRATITVLATSPVAGPARPHQPPPEPSPSPEPEAAPVAPPAAVRPSSGKSKRKKPAKRKTLTTKETAPPEEAKRNLGKAWSKEDLAKLARLAEDKDFLVATIPDHPDPRSSNGDLDWELISSHFGRLSKGGVAVKQQYYAVVRLMKQARGEGKKGMNYVDLVKQALTELSENRGTVYEIHAVLKKKYAKHLDKYKVKGQVRWKKAVGEVLRQETSGFEAVEKTESGKIIWKLK
ncbi:hypothetical protein Ndes2437A_g02856 [Nannochloris sp. 'desiccata']